MPVSLDKLEEALGYRFTNPDLLVRALTHRSLAYEESVQAAGGSEPDAEQDISHTAGNERLEFLGDAVLGLVVAGALFERHPDWREGEMTRIRAELVSRRHMAIVAASLGLGCYLRLGKGEEHSGGRKKAALLANGMEAVLGAMYLDGGLKPVQALANRRILAETEKDLARGLASGAPLGDHKSALQQYLQSNKSGVPVYTVVGVSGPDHRKRFLVEVSLRSAPGYPHSIEAGAKEGAKDVSDRPYDPLSGQQDDQPGPAIASGAGTTKKRAEQEAARLALLQLTAGKPLAAQAEK